MTSLGLKNIAILICSVLGTYNSSAQKPVDSLLWETGITDNNGYCISRLETMNRPKGLEFNYRNILEYEIGTSTLDPDTSYSEVMKRERKLEFKAKIPILLKPQFELILGLNYASEQFKFRGQNFEENLFYSALNRKPLQTFGTTIYATKPFIGNNYMSMRASFRLSGDFSQKSLEDYFRTSVTMLYGWRTSPTFTWAAGVSYSYVFGKQSVFPVVLLSKNFSPKFNLDALLPVRVQLSYAANEKNIFKLETKLSGENYNITLQPYTDNNLFIQRSDWLSLLTYDREIYDFIWIGASFGNRYNISFDLFRKNAFIDRSDPVISNRIQNSFFAQVSVFLVPPRKWKEKHDKKRL